MYLSRRFIEILEKEYGGVWYDKENKGYVDRGSMPLGWDRKLINKGAKKFRQTTKRIGEKYKIITGGVVVEKEIIFYHRGKITTLETDILNINRHKKRQKNRERIKKKEKKREKKKKNI